jgi:hypothetical protein
MQTATLNLCKKQRKASAFQVERWYNSIAIKVWPVHLGGVRATLLTNRNCKGSTIHMTSQHIFWLSLR